MINGEKGDAKGQEINRYLSLAFFLHKAKMALQRSSPIHLTESIFLARTQGT